MKVLFPVEYFYPSLIDGKGSSIYNLTKALSKVNLEINIISSPKGVNLNDTSFDQLYEKYNLDVSFINESFFSHFSFNIIDKVRSSDVVHFSSFFYKLTIWYFFLAFIFNKKIVISPRGEFYEPALRRKKRIKNIYINFFKFFQKKINFHSTNDLEKEIIRNFFPKSFINTIPNLIDIDPPLNFKKNNEILFLGRINPIKNIDILIKAYNQLPIALKDKFKLIIVGEAYLEYEKKYLIKLKKLVNELNLFDNVTFLGPKYGINKFKILSKSYCLVLPSKSENFGNVVLEAISQKTPVITSKNTPWEILIKHNSGYWVDASVKSIKDALINLISLDKKKYTSLQDSALKLINKKFGYDKNISLWKKYYNKINRKLH